MATFIYLGRDQKGQKVKGEVKADNIDAAIKFLQKEAITPLKIEPHKQLFDFQAIKKISLFNKVNIQELLGFCRGMSALNEAGIPLVDAIKQLSLSCTSKIFSLILTEIADNIASGKTLANSLRSYPKIFPPLFTNIIEIGENTGNLSGSFIQLSSYMEMAQTNRRRLVSTLRYPLTVIAVAIIAGILVNVLVIPKFAPIFARYKSELPLPTRIIVGTTNFIVNHWLLLIAIGVAIIIALPYLFLVPRIKFVWDKIKLHIPVLGNLQKRIILFQFTWTFGLILRSGMPLIKGLTFAANATGNSYFNRQIQFMCRNIEKGESLATAAAASRLFPPSVLQMLSVGEESGRLEEILSAITGYYEREVEYDVKRLNDLMEPVLLAIIGFIVLMLALGVYMPLWGLIDFAKVSQ